MSSSTDAGPESLVGRTLDGRYQIDAHIGQGGMGAVYRGTHVLMGRKVALKLLRPERAEDENAIKRFVREAKSTFRFDHPNCVRVNDFGITEEDHLLYLVMEYLDGRTVGEELHYDGPISTSRVIHIGAQVSAALDHAHSLALVHRDLKPDNIMLIKRGTDSDFVKVLDFGLAKLFEGPEGFRTTMMSMSPLTQDGIVFGTPEYMSPEQAMGKPLDPRTDIYSLGVVMYEMLTGLVPFQAASFMGMLTKHVKERAVPPDERRPELGIRPELSQLVMRCLEKKPADRPQSAADLADEIDALQRGFSLITGRVPKAVAESSTMDLSDDADEIADNLARRLRERELESAASAAKPAPHISTPVAELRELYRGRRIALRVVGALAVIAALVIVIVLATRGDGGSKAAAKTSATTDAGSPPSPVDAAVTGSASVDAAAKTAVANADAAARKVRRRPTARSAATRRKIREHLASARAAQRGANTLRQMSESDAALELDPGNREASYLKGDALLRSGDKRNGCRYLRRARVLKKARRRYIGGGCS